MFIPLLIIYLFVVLVICVDVSTICLVHDYTVKFQHVISTIYVMTLVYTWINIIGKLLTYSTIQKPNLCRQFLVNGFAAALKPVSWDIFLALANQNHLMAHCDERVLGRRCHSH